MDALTVIRPARRDDAAAIAAIYAPHVLAGVVSFEAEPPDADAIAARMTACDGLYPWIVAADGDGAVIGYAYAGRFRERDAYRWVVETSVYVADAAQATGIGRRLYAALLDTCRAQGFAQAIGVVALPNDASVRLHRAAGFHHAGMLRAAGYKHGRWIDVDYWQCALADPGLPAPALRPFAEVGVAAP